MKLVYRVLRRFWPSHPHIVGVVDLALAPRVRGSRTVVAYRWKCRVCERDFVERVDGLALPQGSEWMEERIAAGISGTETPMTNGVGDMTKEPQMTPETRRSPETLRGWCRNSDLRERYPGLIESVDAHASAWQADIAKREALERLRDRVGELVGVYDACPRELKVTVPMPIASAFGAVRRTYFQLAALAAEEKKP